MDFYCHAARLVIELDGAQHNETQEMAYDRERTAVLESYHLFVIRFSNQQIDKNFSEVCTQIDQIVKQRTKAFLFEEGGTAQAVTEGAAREKVCIRATLIRLARGSQWLLGSPLGRAGICEAND